jgi:hypothetical protein
MPDEVGRRKESSQIKHDAVTGESGRLRGGHFRRDHPHHTI